MKIGKNLFAISKETKRMIIVAIMIFTGMSLLRPTRFLRGANFLSMGYQLPELGLYSLAMMLTMLSGGIDLSVVPIGNLAGVVSAVILSRAVTQGTTGNQLVVTVILAFSLSIFVGAIAGVLNGVLVAYWKIPPMLLTMSTASIITGISILITKGKSVSGIPEKLLYVGNHTLLGLPYALWLLIVCMIYISFLLRKNTFGLRLKMVGANPVASKYAGINVNATLIRCYFISGVLSSLCGLEILLKTNTAKADYASTYVLQAILCAVLGATNPNGGFAKVSCLALSLLSLQFLSSGFNMLHLSGFYKDFSWGLLLMIVLSLNYFAEKYAKLTRKHNRN